MKYQEYIDLGFIRTNMDDGIEFEQTGYYGFSLLKEINEKMFISVSSLNLDEPKLYIKKQNLDNYHILNITMDIVKDIIN